MTKGAVTAMVTGIWFWVLILTNFFLSILELEVI